MVATRGAGSPRRNCGANLDDVSISPDGTGLAYVIAEGDDSQISTIVVLDVSSGQIRRLESIRTREPGNPAQRGPLGAMHFRPRGLQRGLAMVSGRVNDRLHAHRLSQRQLHDRRGRERSSRAHSIRVGADRRPWWSPDGSRILFHSPTGWDDPEAGRVDIATIHSDGTGLQTLTSDGVSSGPTGPGTAASSSSAGLCRTVAPATCGPWMATAATRRRSPAPFPRSTAVGCTVCPFPVAPNRYLTQGELNERLWQTEPASQ